MARVNARRGSIPTSSAHSSKGFTVTLDRVTYCPYIKSMANVLPRDKQAAVISAIVEGVSVRSIERMTGVHRDTIVRLRNRVQIFSDAFPAYAEAIDSAFDCQVDYAQVIKSYETEPAGSGRYSPPKVTEIEKRAIIGDPNLDTASTSIVERSNLSIRMSNRRMTRLTNAFSKKLENHKAAMALHFANYNLCRVHRSLRITPAMAAGVTDHVWSVEELLEAVGA